MKFLQKVTKNHEKSGFHPLSRKPNFGKTTGEPN